MTDEFTRHFFKFYIAKVASGEFGTVSEMALEIIADVAIYRLMKYSREIRLLIEHSGRTEPNGYDVFNVLWRYRETMSTLACFIVDRHVSTEVNVRDYPISATSKFATSDEQDVLPFRAGAPVDALSTESPLPHIPRFFPSPFGESGIIPDGDDTGASLLRRPADGDAIRSAMRNTVPPAPPQIHIDCPLVREIIKAVIGREPTEL
jgi:hypothetical protein